jgi:integrase
LTAGVISCMRDEMAQKFKPATVNNALSAFRQVLKTAVQSGILPLENYFELASVPGLPGTPAVPSPKSEAENTEIRGIIQSCWDTNTEIGYRDALVCAAVLFDGLTAPMIVKMKVGDIELPSGRLLTVARDFYLHETTRDALGKWLKIRGSSRGFIVQRFRGGDVSEFMSIQTVYDILRRRGAARK